MELLITIALIALLSIAVLILFNPKTQIEKAWDGKRKNELTTLHKILEDYYNDKQCYPKPNEVCYNATGGTTCNICGNEPSSPNLSPYLSRLPCDPQHPLKKYLYQVDNVNCPTWYRIYDILSNTSDSVITAVGCKNGCGPSPNFIYNYGISSPNIGLEANNNLCSHAAPLYINPFCNICGTYNDCKTKYPNKTYYIDPGSCSIPCIKD
jgi:hypothetical protein